MSYKQEKIIVIASEFINDKREYYPITDVPVEKARFFYKDDDGLFKAMSSSDYAVRTETNEARLYITNEKIKTESFKFQIGYEINFLASEYETSLPVLSVLVEMYNTLIEDSRNIFNYVKKQCFISDDKTTGLILPNLPPHSVWCMGENGEMFALPVSELCGKFQQMINSLYETIKKLVDKDYTDFSETIKQDLAKHLTDLKNKTDEYIRALKNETDNQKIELDKYTLSKIEEIKNACDRIIGLALNKLTTANTIEQLKTMNFLKVGDIVEVLGYYTAGDRAGHKRIIANEDDGSGVQLKNGLWANIIHNGEVNVSWFGCKYNSLESARTNYTNLLKAINYNQTVNITGDLYIEQNGDNIVTSDNLILKGKDKAKLILCTNFENTDWFVINKNLKNLSFTDLEVKFNATTERTSVLFAINGMIKVNNCNIENCVFNINTHGRLMWWSNSNLNIQPDLSLHGFDIFNLKNNTFNNILNSFIVLSDVIYREFNIINNKINNFYYTFICCETTNENTFEKEITDNKLLTNIYNNIVINEDNCILDEGQEQNYYYFALFETNIVNYKDNYIEGIKSKDKAPLYDSYFSGNYLYYENNTWKNNLCFNINKENANLMKSKGVVNKYYRNNNYIIEEEWLKKFNVDEKAKWVLLNEQTSHSDNTVIDNNYIDVYEIRFYSSTPSVTNYIFTNNKINSKKFNYPFIIPGHSDEKIKVSDYIVRNNVCNIGECFANSLIQVYNEKVLNSKYKNIIIENNSFYFYLNDSVKNFYTISATFLANNTFINNNKFIGTTDNSSAKNYMFNRYHYFYSDKFEFLNNSFLNTQKLSDDYNFLSLDIIPRIKSNTSLKYESTVIGKLYLIFIGTFNDRKNTADISKISYKVKLIIKNDNKVDEIRYLLFDLEKVNNQEKFTFYNRTGSQETVIVDVESVSSIFNNFYLLDESGAITKDYVSTAVKNLQVEFYLESKKTYDRLNVEINIIGG